MISDSVHDSASHRCGCGKMAYPSRRSAKRTAVRLHPGSRMRAYRCDYVSGEVWHLGHLPARVRLGDAVYYPAEVMS